MVGIAGDVAGGGALHFAGSVGEAVPNGFAFAVFGPGAFDLIGGGCGAPNKLLGKLERRELRLRMQQFAEEPTARRHDRKRSGGSKGGGEKFTAIETVPSAHRVSPRLRRVPNWKGGKIGRAAGWGR